MEDNSEVLTYEHRPIYQVRRFITRVWEHPLVNENTRKHRELAKNRLAEELREVFEKRDLFPPKTFCTVPVGSLLWLTDEKSDFDYHLVIGEKEDWENTKITGHSWKNVGPEQWQIIKKRLHPLKIDINSPPMFERSETLLFTPDDLIGGNLKIAQRIRKKTAEEIINSEDKDLIWKRQQNYFKRYFSQQDKTSGPDGFVKGPKKGRRIRSRRTERALDKQASQSGNPTKYKKTFMKIKENLTLPDVNTYCLALIENNGALSLLK
ncbi:hypothetical protein COT75_05465 [Candidatus Beckwithbacteria bacterium CG10_big_fil_rev_8_21_14_0_10_34_10]|uniref:Uncharacterized protein n=1 Tax=Candidatus Beckwithbacteria bacterium CG10_big_fil_rev_8_21_14_0_10_34_10 TaxID=1974495 RepID=A0A2H0W7N9_9BACT|nr:MAG: hypothetical protein COT75_05465 [Candidatus Beckwithbacteria bacterium CG10_big_fil_rev_8_21_14_0_10_34_10]